MSETLVTLRAPDKGGRQGFTCGVVVVEGMVTETAPIVKFMRGWSADAVRKYCRDVGWTATVLKKKDDNGS